MAFGHEKLDDCRAAIEYERRRRPRPVLDRIVAMLTRLGQRGYAVHGETEECRTNQIDPDTDPDR